MTAAEACLKLVEELPGSLVESLIAQLRGGVAPAMPNPGYQGRVDEFLRSRSEHARRVGADAGSGAGGKRSRQTTELVWTGPSTPVVPVRRTEQVLCDLIRCAERRLTMTSFGIFQVPRLVKNWSGRWSGASRCASCWAIGKPTATRRSTASGSNWAERWPLERRFCSGRTERRPRDEQGHAGLMHVKAAVADSKVAFLTSANLTEAALERNMELGVLIRGGSLPAAIDRLIDTLVESGELQTL